MRRYLLALSLGAVVAFSGFRAEAQQTDSKSVGSLAAATDIPRTLSYQGVLRDETGAAVADGEYSVAVRLYADQDGTHKVWEGVYVTKVRNGLFDLLLGAGSYPLPNADVMNSPLWTGIQVGNSPELRPLSTLSATPYALNVANNSITKDKIAADYVGSLSINGQKVSGRGSDVNIIAGDGMSATVDPGTNNVIVAADQAVARLKHGEISTNTVVSGTLAVTQGVVLNTNSGTTTVGSNGNGVQGMLSLAQGTPGGYLLTIQAPGSMTGNVTLSLPSTSGNLVGDTRTISTGTGLQGGGNLSANRTISVDATVTTQGNTFNGNSQLVKTTAGGGYPALDGSLITGIAGAHVTGTVANASEATHANTASSATNASHATSASSATNASHATSASSATNASHATSASSATNASHATSASSATNSSHATSASSATNAGHATSASSATNAGHATSASSANNAGHATTASNASHATSASSATNAGHATSASNAGHATVASSATNAEHATSASSATNAAHATSASSATNAVHATSASNAINSTHAANASFADVAQIASTALHVDHVFNADHATNASFADNVAHATNASIAYQAVDSFTIRSSNPLNADITLSASGGFLQLGSGIFSILANLEGHAEFASHSDTATNSGHATTASTAAYATNAGHASSADTATHATTASHATNASYADNAGSAGSATNAGHADNAGYATNAGNAATVSNGVYNNQDNDMGDFNINNVNQLQVHELVPHSVAILVDGAFDMQTHDIQNGGAISGTFSGDGTNVTNVNPANIATGTAAISISGNAANASHAGTASHATSASAADIAVHAAHASHAGIASHATSASAADIAVHAAHASHAGIASHATSASAADIAVHAAHASHAGIASHATSASHAGTASHATTASAADTAVHATSASNAATVSNGVYNNQNNDMGDFNINDVNQLQVHELVPHSVAILVDGAFDMQSHDIQNGGTISGTLSGDGSNVININPANIAGGTAPISISGNAATVSSVDPTTITPGTASISISGNAATVTSVDPTTITPGTAGINISGNAATVSHGVYNNQDNNMGGFNIYDVNQLGVNQLGVNELSPSSTAILVDGGFEMQNNNIYNGGLITGSFDGDGSSIYNVNAATVTNGVYNNIANDMGGNQINNVADPTADGDVVTLHFLHAHYSSYYTARAIGPQNVGGAQWANGVEQDELSSSSLQSLHDAENNPTGGMGIGTSTPRASLEVAGTDGIIVPVGTVAERPVAPVKGTIRFNTTSGHFEGYNGKEWRVLDAGSN